MNGLPDYKTEPVGFCLGEFPLATGPKVNKHIVYHSSPRAEKKMMFYLPKILSGP